MENYYEINVSRKGVHFFATAPRSCLTEQQARVVFNVLRRAFSAEAGYELRVTHWEGAGNTVSFTSDGE